MADHDLDKHVRGGAEHGDCGHDGEGGVGHQTQPVQHHGRELPVTLHRPALLVLSDLVGDHLDLLQYETQLPVQRMIGAGHCCLLRPHTAGGAETWVIIILLCFGHLLWLCQIKMQLSSQNIKTI